jgi:hypothetical protein
MSRGRQAALKPREANMENRRVVLDCRNKSDANCSLAISGTETEVLDLAEYHASTKHGMKKEPGLREQLKGFLKEESMAR